MKTALIDLTGHRFGRLLVTGRELPTRPGGSRWHCQCDCGKAHVVSVYSLRNGATRSCGCLMNETRRKHGGKHEYTAEYRIWHGIKRRCNCPASINYLHYGARGIRMCPEWSGSFGAFLKSVGTRPSPLHSIDRINVDRGYEPGNVQWSDRVTQARNRTDNVRIEYAGETLTMAGWTERLGVPSGMIAGRIYRGWHPEDAVSVPKGGKRTRSVELAPGAADRRRAKNAVQKAVSRGSIVRPQRCESPGCDIAKPSAHHHKGYAPEHRLVVVWLCAICYATANPGRDERRRATRAARSRRQVYE